MSKTQKCHRVEFESSAGLQKAYYQYENENGNSSPCELFLNFEQQGDFDSTKGIKINFFGDWEHDGFVRFCHKIAKQFPVRKITLIEQLRLKIRQWLQV